MKERTNSIHSTQIARIERLFKICFSMEKLLLILLNWGYGGGGGKMRERERKSEWIPKTGQNWLNGWLIMLLQLNVSMKLWFQYVYIRQRFTLNSIFVCTILIKTWASHDGDSIQRILHALTHFFFIYVPIKKTTYTVSILTV